MMYYMDAGLPNTVTFMSLNRKIKQMQIPEMSGELYCKVDAAKGNTERIESACMLFMNRVKEAIKAEAIVYNTLPCFFFATA